MCSPKANSVDHTISRKVAWVERTRTGTCVACRPETEDHMRGFRPMGIILLAGASVSACGAADDSKPDDAATPVVETSSASTLVLIVQARIGASANGELAEHEGAFIDKRQIRSVALTVDGR